MKRFLKLRHIRDDAVGAVLLRRMRIDGGAQALGLVAGLSAPTLPVADKETLIGREAIDRLKLLALGIFLPREIGEQQPAEVGNILAQRQLAVDLDVVDDCVCRILVRDATGALLEFFSVVLGPPVAQVSLCVELAAFIVEAVSQFVTDGAAGVAVVRSGVRLGIEQAAAECPPES